MKQTRIAAIVLMFMAVVFTANAQNIKTYSGQMSKPDWLADLIGEEYMQGKGSYSYYEDAQENRIIHGNFNLTFSKDALFGTIFKETITGSYSHGKRNGQWTMRSVDINGKVFSQYRFQYKDGVLHGSFSYTEDGGGSVTCTFNNGVLSGTYTNVYVTTGGCTHTTSGKVDSEGRPHGEWTIVSKGPGIVPKDRTRLYYKGCLVYYREKDHSTGKITYENQISPSIRTATDISKIHDTIINGTSYIDVGGVICGIRPISSWSAGDYTGYLSKIYPNINKWNVEFDPTPVSNSGPNSEPEFIGGESALNKYIEDNLQYPPLARENYITGNVIVSFYVEPDGSLTEIKVKRDIGGGCGKEAVRLVQSMPKWKPGKGQVERMPYTLTIPFQLN